MLVDFFFGPGSRYSYLAATQLDRVSAESGARFRWRAVLSRDLTARTGGVPRSPQDVVWRTVDVERWARHYGVPFRDVSGDVDWRDLALACAAAQAMDQAEPFARALYAQIYGRGDVPQDVVAFTATLGLSAQQFAQALADDAEAVYAANLEAALDAGAFGVPTFVTPDGAVFWGQDRLPLLMDHLRSV